MVACTYYHSINFARRYNNTRQGFGISTIYLRTFLTIDMIVKKKKMPIRVPVPQKPPKTELDKKVYNRKKERKKLKDSSGDTE